MSTISSANYTYNSIVKQEESSSTKTTSSGGITTDRGTPILTSYNDSMNSLSFMKMLAAQLSNMDPSTDQDPTAYITQMAQFVEMQNMDKLNTTMNDFANRELIGKIVVLKNTDNKGQNIAGEVETIYKNNGQSFLAFKDDKDKTLYPVDNVLMVTSSAEDNSQAITALNTAFAAASELANNKSNVLIQVKDGENVSTVKGQAVGAFIDNSNVMLKVNVMDDEGNLTNKIENYSYFSLIKGGDLNPSELSEDSTSTQSSTDTNKTSNTTDKDNTTTDKTESDSITSESASTSGTDSTSEDKTEVDNTGKVESSTVTDGTETTDTDGVSAASSVAGNASVSDSAFRDTSINEDKELEFLNNYLNL